MKISFSLLKFITCIYFNGNIYIFTYEIGRKLEYVDSFISMDLNVIEYITNLEVIREYCIKNCNGSDNSFTICRQINEIEKLLVEDVSETPSEKNENLRLNLLLTTLGKKLGCYIDEKVKNWTRNLLHHESIYDIKPPKLKISEKIIVLL